VRLELPLLALWVLLALALSQLAGRVADWFVMTDELLYERLALSVWQDGSPLPHVHGELIPSLNQLYPLLIAPAFAGDGTIQGALHDAHLVNAWVMSSACIPAFLLARRVTGSRPVAYAVALASVCVPWVVLSSFLLTEVAGYPAFLWAMLALQRAVAAPSRRNDAVLLGALVVAVLARTQLLVLAAVAPAAILACELGRGDPRAALRSHRVLSVAYAAGLAAVLAAAAAGRLSDALGTYGSTLGGNLLPNGLGRSLAEHTAALALGLAILPFLAGAAWLTANLVRPPAGRERHAFACGASIALAALLVEVALFDLRSGGGDVRDRYLFYLAPLVLVGFACALLDERWPRWSLLLPTALVASGFAASPWPVFDKLNVDAPVAALHDWLLRVGGSLWGTRATLALATAVLAGAFALAARHLPHRPVALVLAAATLVALPLEARVAYVHLFRVNGTSGRPLTLAQGLFSDFIDRAAGTRPDVTIVPYPGLPGDYWASVAAWWDLEFWNRSVVRTAGRPGEFEWTPSTFPKLELRFDPRTGRANVSPTRYVALSDKETRFRVRGTAIVDDRDTMVIDAGGRWRADWISSGLDDDGWTRPGRVARIRVFSAPGQQGWRIRGVNLGVRAPADVAARPFTVSSNVELQPNVATNGKTFYRTIPICVPPRGSTDIVIRSPAGSPVYGDMRDASSVGEYRVGGVLFTQIALADELGGYCKPARSP
jgi:hypothetical protein